MANAIELATYRYVVRNMVSKAALVDLPVDKDGVFTDEAIELCVRRYWIAKESARNCADAIIANDA